jgi:hypothetical protein
MVSNLKTTPLPRNMLTHIICLIRQIQAVTTSKRAHIQRAVNVWTMLCKGYSASNLWWAVNKTTRKNFVTYEKHIIVAAGIEALLISWRKFLYACVKEVCHLFAQPHFDTFCQVIIIEVPWSQPFLWVGKQEVVAWSEIRAVKRVIKQFPFETPQQFFSVSSCVQIHFHRGALCQMSAHFFPPVAFLFYPRKQLASAFWQADKMCLNFIDFYGECVCSHCFDCSLVSTFRNETQISSLGTCVVWLGNVFPSLCQKAQHKESYSLCVMCTHEYFWNSFCQNLSVA